MKLLSKIVLFFLHLTISTAIFMFFFSLGIRPVFQMVVKKNVIQNSSIDILYSTLRLDVEKVHRILESEKIDSIIDEYIDMSLEAIINPSSLEDIKLGETIFQYVKDHKKELEEELSIEINSSFLEDVDFNNQIRLFDSQFQSALAMASNQLSESDKSVLRLYQKFVTIHFRYFLIFVFIISLILTLIFNLKDLRQFIKRLAIDFLSSGFFLIICTIFLSMSLKKLSFQLNIFDVSFIPYSFICFVIGILLFLFHFLFPKKENNVIPA